MLDATEHFDTGFQRFQVPSGVSTIAHASVHRELPFAGHAKFRCNPELHVRWRRRPTASDAMSVSRNRAEGSEECRRRPLLVAGGAKREFAIRADDRRGFERQLAEAGAANACAVRDWAPRFRILSSYGTSTTCGTWNLRNFSRWLRSLRTPECREDPAREASASAAGRPPRCAGTRPDTGPCSTTCSTTPRLAHGRQQAVETEVAQAVGVEVLPDLLERVRRRDQLGRAAACRRRRSTARSSADS